MRCILGLLVVLLACHRRVQPEPEVLLEGLVLPLLSGHSAAFRVPGRFGERSAEVVLDLSAPLSSIGEACYAPGPLPESGGQVRLPTPSGRWRELPEVLLGGLELGGRRLPPWVVALVPGGRGCEVTLGSDVLGGLALELDLPRRELRLLPASTAEAYRALPPRPGEERTLVELTRAPSTDWLLLPARIVQGKATLTGTFVLATGEAQSALSNDAAERAGLRRAPDLLEALGLPMPAGLPEVLPSTYTLDRVELAPNLPLRFATANGVDGWAQSALVGVLGADAWGHFSLTLDARAQLLVLRRPILTGEGVRQRCTQLGAAAPAPPSEEACFELLLTRGADGNGVLLATVWRALPEGGRLHAELLDGQGQPLGGLCQVGFSFSPSDRGAIASQRLVPPNLASALPECAELLSSAQAARLALLEEGGPEACPGGCGFVRHVPTGRLVCDCPPRWDQAASRIRELYQELMRQRPRPPGGSEEPAEPLDPDAVEGEPGEPDDGL